MERRLESLQKLSEVMERYHDDQMRKKQGNKVVKDNDSKKLEIKDEYASKRDFGGDTNRYDHIQQSTESHSKMILSS